MNAASAIPTPPSEPMYRSSCGKRQRELLSMRVAADRNLVLERLALLADARVVAATVDVDQSKRRGGLMPVKVPPDLVGR
jgi:hypothetical protein